MSKAILMVGYVFFLVLPLFASSFEDLIEQIEKLLEKESYDIALEEVSKFEQLNPNNIRALYLKAEILMLLGKYEEANRNLNKSEELADLQKIELSADFFYNKGVTLYKINRYEESITYLKKVEEIDRSFQAVYLEQALVFNALGQRNEAELALEKYIKYETNSISKKLAIDMLEETKRMNKGIFYLLDKEYGKALFVFEAMVDKDKNNGITHYYLGKTYRMTGDYAKALFHFNTAQSLGVKEDIEFELGIISLDKRDKEKAKEHLQKYIYEGANNELVKFSESTVNKLQKAKPWSIQATLGVEYDNNVFSFGNDFVNIFVEDKDESTWASFFGLYADYIVIEKEKNLLRLGFEYYSKYYDEFAELNVYEFEFIVLSSNKLSKNLTFDVELSYEYIFLGGDPYQDRINSAISLTYEFSSWIKFALFYDFTYREDFTDNFFDELDRSGPGNSIGFSQEFVFSEIGLSLLFGYKFFDNNPKGEDLEYQSHILSSALVYNLPSDVQVSVNLSYLFTKYANGNLLLVGNREDKTGSISVGINKKFMDHFTVFANFNYSHNSSEKEFGFELFDYNRNITRIGMTFSY